ncbi:MAG: hypothetical protein WCA79_09055 [Anaerolineales bacterium]
MPSSSEWLLRILSGMAWISFEGQDFFLGNDESLVIPKAKNAAIISAARNAALFPEIT